jgi:hypothetical protein
MRPIGIYIFGMRKGSNLPVRNNVPLLCPVYHAVPETVLAQGGAGLWSEVDFSMIPARFNALVEFLTELTFSKCRGLLSRLFKDLFERNSFF